VFIPRTVKLTRRTIFILARDTETDNACRVETRRAQKHEPDGASIVLQTHRSYRDFIFVALFIINNTNNFVQNKNIKK